MPSNVRRSGIFSPRGISSLCFVAAPALEKASRSGKSKRRSTERAARFVCSLRNGSRSRTWNGTALPARRPSAPFSRAVPCLAVRSSWWMRPDRSAASKCSNCVSAESWSEIHEVNEQVRDGLKAQGLIGQSETVVTALERLDLTDAQKRDQRFYNSDSVVVFNQATSGFKSGDNGQLLGITDKHL